MAFPIARSRSTSCRARAARPDFLAKNPSGQIPLLEVAPGRFLAESNAILWYVAADTTLVPEDRIARAEAMQWMFFEQHSLEPNIGAAFFWLALIKGGRELQQHALEDWMENGYRALAVMEVHLTKYPFFVSNRFTLADIALYAYTHVAHECDFDLSRFPAIRRWLERVEAEPGHVTMDWQPEADGGGAVAAAVNLSLTRFTKPPHFLNGFAPVRSHARPGRRMTDFGRA